MITFAKLLNPQVLVTHIGYICAGSDRRHTLRWRHNEQHSVSNHQPHDCLLNRIFRRRSKKTSKIRVTGLCARNSPGTGGFPAQMASYAEMFPFDDVIMITVNVDALASVGTRTSPGTGLIAETDIFSWTAHWLSIMSINVSWSSWSQATGQ